jgi:hypothetical protein
VIYEPLWDLGLESNGQARGTLAIKRSWYRLLGTAVSAGDVEVAHDNSEQSF